jgi:hypothetical protein
MKTAQYIGELDRAYKSLSEDIQNLSNYSWSGSSTEQFVEFVKRSALIRQYEAIAAVRSAFENGTSHLLASLLRPAYEEMLWLEYIRKHKEVSLDLILSMAQNEVYNGIEAQRGYLTKSELNEIGFTSSILKAASEALKRTEDSLLAIGKKLSWRQGALKPTITSIAKSVGRHEEYLFLYHGTSRAVHFSPHELGRRVWGSYGDVKISSNNFSSYWNDFTIIWQWRIFSESALASEYDFRKSSFAWGNKEIFISLLELLPRVQIVTRGELERWPEPRFERR